MNLIERQRGICDTRLQHTALRLLGEHEMPLNLIIDRLLTVAAAWTVVDQPTRAEAAAVFRQVADAIEAGVFDKVTGATQ